MNLLERIAQAIARTEDRRRLRLLNRLWWRIYFRLQRQQSELRKAA
jgi:hypothetical protein